MLERACPSAECAAHVFLRQYEAPVRSSRYLGPSFWKHGQDQVNTSAWWPVYLDSLRSSNRNSQPTRAAQTTDLPLPVYRPRNTTSRNFSLSFLHSQVALARPSAGEESQNSQNDGLETVVPFNLPKEKEKRHIATKTSSSRSTQSLWSSFVKDGSLESQAPRLFRRLAVKKLDTDLEYALRAFNYMSAKDRTPQDYYTAVDVAIRLDKFSVATQLIREATSRHASQEALVNLLATCVSNTMWNTAADVWRSMSTELLEVESREATKRRNFAGKFISRFDTVVGLPAKLVGLEARLARNDPVLIAKKDIHVDMLRALCLLAVENDSVMSSITSEGLLKLVNIYQHSGRGLHSAALATINRSPNKGSLSRLAILVYNNMKSGQSDRFISRWVLRAMLSICAAGRQSSEMYREILADYTQRYGRLDVDTFSQAIRTFADEGSRQDAQRLFEDFYQNKPPSHSDDLNPLIRVHAVTGDCENAQLQFDLLHTKYNLKPGAKSWNNLLIAYTRSSKPAVAYAKFQEMKRTGVQPDQYSWSILVGSAAKRGDVEYARQLTRQAISVGINPPLAMVGAIVDACLSNDKVSEARLLVEEATKRAHQSSENPIRLWNSLFRHFAFKSDSESILKTQAAMKKYNVQADGMTYAALMTALVVQGKTDDASKILRTLHFSRSISANEFHYSILIHGFAMEGEAEKAVILYREMQQRFASTTPSADLSMLHLRALRSERAAKSDYLSGKPYLKPDFTSALDSIEEVLSNIRPKDLTSKLPQPGFGRRSLHDDTQGLYFGTLIKFLHRNNAYTSAQAVQDYVERNQKPTSWRHTLEQLAQKMQSLSVEQNWTGVSKTWNQVMQIALNNCRPSSWTDMALLAGRVDTSVSRTSTSLSVENKPFRGMIPDQLAKSVTTAPNKILAANQYILSRHLSQYMQALEKQSLHVKILATVDDFQAQGFSLSNKNWNSLIQILCRSPNSDDRILAYGLFEKHLLPHAPSWKVISRGKWVDPAREKPGNQWDVRLKREDKRTSRKMLEKSDPGLLMPSYYTMIHLATVWSRASRAFVVGDDRDKNLLEEKSPRTVRRVMRTPYLRDKVQGVLLRGRRVVGDPVKRPRQISSSLDFTGVQGSNLIADQISSESHIPINLATAEAVMGDIPRSRIFLPAKGRLETWEQRRTRVKATSQQLLDKLRQIKDESQQDGLLVSGSFTRGDPATGPVHIVPSGDATQDIVFRSVSSRNKSNMTPRQLRNLKNALRRTSQSLLHQPAAIKASRQKGAIRTSVLTRRHTPQMVSDGLVVSSRRSHRPSRRTVVPQMTSAPPKRVHQVHNIQFFMSRKLERNLKQYQTKLALLKRRSKIRAIPSQKLNRRLLELEQITSNISNRLVILRRKTWQERED